MATGGDPSLPPPTPQALQLLMTPAPADQAGYYPRYVQTFTRSLYPAGLARQMVPILASGSRKSARAAVRVPTLVIHGEADPLVPVAHGIDVAATVPGAQRLIIEGVGYALSITQWPRIVEAVAVLAGQPQALPAH